MLRSLSVWVFLYARILFASMLIYRGWYWQPLSYSRASCVLLSCHTHLIECPYNGRHMGHGPVKAWKQLFLGFLAVFVASEPHTAPS